MIRTFKGVSRTRAVFGIEKMAETSKTRFSAGGGAFFDSKGESTARNRPCGKVIRTQVIPTAKLRWDRAARFSKGAGIAFSELAWLR
jgi:hypothetical protein